MDKPVILLVVNNRNEEKIFRQAFGELDGPHKVVIAHSIQAAQDYLNCEGDYIERGAHEDPRLILIDLEFGKSVELLKYLWQKEALRIIPAIVFSSVDNNEEILKTYRLHANSFVQKPDDPEALKTTIEQLVHYWLDINCMGPVDTCGKNANLAWRFT